MGFIPLPESDNFVEKNPKRRQMSEHDQEYVVKCIRKHGENYKAMERDIITNDQQYTEDKMKKLCARYLALGNRDKLVKL
jgi:nucleolar protein 16